MALPAADLVIGSTTLDILDHDVKEIPLGLDSGLEMDMSTWIGGMLTVEQGIEYADTPQYLSARVDASFPGQVVCMPNATTIAVASGANALSMPVEQVDFTPSGGSINTYIVTEGRYVHRLSSTSTLAAPEGWKDVLDLGAGVRSFDIEPYGGRLGVAYGTGYQHTPDGVTWANATGTLNYAHAFAALGAQLWRGERPNLLYSTLGGYAGAWSSSNTVGDAGYNLNSLVGMEQLLMVGKADGVYTIDSEGLTVPMVPELRPQANADFASVRAAVTFNGDYYFRTLDGIIQIDPGGGKTRIGIDRLSTPDLPTPRVRALCADDRFLYALLDNTSGDLYIMRMSPQGAWHVFYWESGAGRGNHISYSGALGYPALFFSYGSSPVVVKYIRLSTFPSPIQDSNYRYSTAANQYIRLPRIRKGVPAVIDRVVVQGRQLSATEKLQVFFATDGGAVTQFGTDVTSSPTTLTPTAAISGAYFDPYVYLTTGATTTTPILVSITIQGVWRGGKRFKHTYTVDGSQRHDTRRGGSSRKPVEELITDLETARSTNTYQTCVDEYQRTFQALVADVSRHVQRVPKSADLKDLKGVFQVSLLEKP